MFWEFPFCTKFLNTSEQPGNWQRHLGYFPNFKDKNSSNRPKLVIWSPEHFTRGCILSTWRHHQNPKSVCSLFPIWKIRRSLYFKFTLVVCMHECIMIKPRNIDENPTKSVNTKDYLLLMYYLWQMSLVHCILTKYMFKTSYTICYVDIIPKCTGFIMSMLEIRQPVLKMFPLRIPPINVGFMLQVVLREAFNFSPKSCQSTLKPHVYPISLFFFLSYQ